MGHCIVPYCILQMVTIFLSSNWDLIWMCMDVSRGDMCCLCIDCSYLKFNSRNNKSLLCVRALPHILSKLSLRNFLSERIQQTRTMGLWSSAATCPSSGKPKWNYQSRPNPCAMKTLKVGTEDPLLSDSTTPSGTACLHSTAVLLHERMPCRGASLSCYHLAVGY